MSAALAPELRYVDDGEPGWQRRRRGRGFEYRDGRNRIEPDDPRLERVRALAIPPAWTNVWICADPRGHLQATGRDARGRKQYRYHAEWREFRDRVKFDRMLLFGRSLPDIRRSMEADLDVRGLPREKVIAAIVRLLETTLIRVGNEEYARENASFGLTTLRHRHARLVDGGVRFRFVGKGGRVHVIESDDPRVARVVHRCQELPGQELFQYVEDDVTRCIQSQDVNDYLRAASGIDVTAKDYRTWIGTVRTAALLGRSAPVDDVSSRQAVVRAAIEATAESLGNTPAVCRASYVHPIVLDCYETGELHERWSGRSARSPVRLTGDERRVLALLRDHTPHARRRPAETDRRALAAA